MLDRFERFSLAISEIDRRGGIFLSNKSSLFLRLSANYQQVTSLKTSQTEKVRK